MPSSETVMEPCLARLIPRKRGNALDLCFVRRNMRLMNWIRTTPDGVHVTVRVQPRATRNAVVGLHGDALKIKLTAPPVEGEANMALIAFLSEILRIPRSRIRIVMGAKSRTKCVEVLGCTAKDALTALRPESDAPLR